MRLLLFIILLAVPVAEIAVFIQAGELIGWLPTIAITIGTAIAGSFLMRVQGFAALNRFSESATRGEMPVTPVLDSLGILTAGVLLLLPGLLTDAVGLLLFIPPVRRSLARWFFRRAVESGKVRFAGFGQAGAHSRGSGYRGSAASGFKRPSNDNVVDVEFETIRPDEETAAPQLGEEQKTNGKSGKDTPWRRH